MKFLLLALGLLIPIACGTFEKKDVEPDEPFVSNEEASMEKVESLLAEYCALSLPLFQQRNHIVRKCDALFFAGQHKVACGWPELAGWEGEKGQWFRSLEHDCFIPPDTDNGATAQLSKDMVVGWLLSSVLDGNKERVRDFVKRAEANAFSFCKAIDVVTHLSKCVLPHSLWKRMTDFAGMKTQLPLDDDQSKSLINIKKAEFEHHLEMLGILTDGVIYGAISKSQQEALKNHAARQNQNPQYLGAHALYAGGDMEVAATELLKQCPQGRLPNNHDDWCTEYRWNRDQLNQGDWAPCKDEPKVTHFGTECVLAAAVITGKVKR